MPGVIIFDPDKEEVGFSTGTDQAAGVFLDIETDVLYFTDTANIYEWEGDSVNELTYTWRSGVIRLQNKVNLGAVSIEAETYDSVLFKIYADDVLITTLVITDNEPVRLPGGYTSNLYEVEIISTDRVTRISLAQNIFELAAG